VPPPSMGEPGKPGDAKSEPPAPMDDLEKQLRNR